MARLHHNLLSVTTTVVEAHVPVSGMVYMLVQYSAHMYTHEEDGLPSFPPMLVHVTALLQL